MADYKIRTTENNRSVLTDGRVYIPFDAMQKNVKNTICAFDGQTVNIVTYAFEFYCKGAFVGTLYLDNKDDSLTDGKSIYRPSVNPCRNPFDKVSSKKGKKKSHKKDDSQWYIDCCIANDFEGNDD